MRSVILSGGLLVGTILAVLGSLTHAAEPQIKTVFTGMDRNSNGTVSQEEFLAAAAPADQKLARRNFSVIDFDRNGALTFEEYLALPGLVPIEQRGAVPDPVAELAAEAVKKWKSILTAADKDQDSKLTAKEWPQADLSAKLAQLGDLKFEAWDADQNGTVDLEEAEKLIAVAFGTNSPDETSLRTTNGRVLFLSWIRGADKNNDQLVSRTEFVASYWLTPPERLKQFTSLDEDKDGNLSYPEMLESPALNVDVMSMFLFLDKDLDGLLSETEMSGNASTGATPQHTAQSLAACDDDHDGKLSLREYTLAPAGMGYVTLRLFDRKDSDNDGFLGWPEFYTEPSPVMIGVAAELFRRFDQNRDRKLGLDEFQFTVLPSKVPSDVVFRMKDRDRDGKLALTEIFTPSQPAAEDPGALERYQLRLKRATTKFQQDDANQNGSLDVAEFSRAREMATKDSSETPGQYSTRLFIADSDGSNMKQLTDLPDFQSQGSPNWSRDGKYITFDGWRPQNGQNVSGSKIVVVQSDGLNPQVLGDGAMPTFSPGGQRVSYSNPKAGGIWITSAHEPEFEPIAFNRHGWGSDWSADGRLVYASHAQGRANLAVYSLVEGHTVHLLVPEKSPYQQIFWNMAWSPDSKRIVFKAMTMEGKQEIGIIDARGEKFGFIRRYEGNILATFAWSPIETRILFVAQDPDSKRNQLWFVDPDSKDPPRLLPGQDDLRNHSDVAYSPDGKRIVFSCGPRTSPE